MSSLSELVSRELAKDIDDPVKFVLELWVEFLHRAIKPSYCFDKKDRIKLAGFRNFGREMRNYYLMFNNLGSEMPDVVSMALLENLNEYLERASEVKEVRSFEETDKLVNELCRGYNELAKYLREIRIAR